jgi:hypothetical protein
MIRLAACALMAGLALGLATAGEEKVPLDKLPEAVTKAVKKRFPKAELIEASKETEGTKVEYEVTIKDNGVKMDVTFDPDGTLTLIEKTIAQKDLPKAVTDALEAKYPKATYSICEEVIKVTAGKEKLDFYEVVLTTAEKKSWEVKVSPEGKITGTEEKTGEKEEKKEEKKDK